MGGIDSELFGKECRGALKSKFLSLDVMAGDVTQFLSGAGPIFDLIAANDVVEHIPKGEAIAFLQSLRAGLRAGGKVLIKVPNMGNPFSMSLRYGDFTHEAGYTESSLAQILHLAGFRDIRVFGSRSSDRSWKAPLHRTAQRALHWGIRRTLMELGYNVPSILDSLLLATAQP